MTTTPELGQMVHYKLTAADAEAINRRRRHAQTHRGGHTYQQTGYQAHQGNYAYAGDVHAAHVVRIFDGETASRANLQVHLDGNDTHWATSAAHGHEHGQWHRPDEEQPHEHLVHEEQIVNPDHEQHPHHNED